MIRTGWSANTPTSDVGRVVVCRAALRGVQGVARAILLRRLSRLDVRLVGPEGGPTGGQRLLVVVGPSGRQVGLHTGRYDDGAVLAALSALGLSMSDYRATF